VFEHQKQHWAMLGKSALVILPLAALIGLTVSDGSSGSEKLLAIAVAILLLYLFAGLLSMIAGYCVHFAGGSPEIARRLIGFGAACGCWFFLAIGFVEYFWHKER
jgi:hypothetical protein